MKMYVPGLFSLSLRRSVKGQYPSSTKPLGRKMVNGRYF